MLKQSQVEEANKSMAFKLQQAKPTISTKNDDYLASGSKVHQGFMTKRSNSHNNFKGR
jgi:hypothetical protein